MQLQHLRYLVALARTRHFAMAASECGVSQPTLSAGLAALEQELGKRLVERDRRFIGLTDQGRAILPWAEQALGAVRGITQAAASDAAALSGEFRLFVIPSAQPLVGPFGDALVRSCPGLTLAITAGTSREIEHALHANEVDAGLTYLDHEPPTNMLTAPLHNEQYRLIARAGTGFDARREISWEQAAALPLCLLHQGMQYRRILDAQFAQAGLSVRPKAIADNYISLFSLVRSGHFVSIVPDAYAGLFDGVDWCQFVPISPEVAVRRLGLVVVNRDPLGSMARAGLTAAQQFDPADMIEKFYHPSNHSI
ncbi:MAG: LysR family transcriptional regulator [Novosphingobium sp.]|uniref:LysR family transcriptional regulator n=1 Tax=Novosphingobium sp. TaxID=1874826 RepID=UPI0032BBCACB